MAVSHETIEQIRLATDIVELVREYVPALKKSGRNWKANCPFHHERTPSFMVNPEKGIFHCFGCHQGGDAYKFVMLADSLTWPEAIEKLARRCGITIRQTKEDIVKRSEKQKIYDLLEQAADFYHRCLLKSPEDAHALAYLKKRGVTADAIERFKLGFSPSGSLIASAAKKGHAIEHLISAGLVTKTERGKYYEYMSGRLVFPIFDTQGRVVAFGGRTLKDEQPKYLNTPETAVYSKSQHLYGLFQATPSLRQTKELVVLEGYMDVVVTHQMGASCTVATLGTAFTAQQVAIVNRYAETVVLLFDADAAGNQAAKRAIEALLETELTIRVANLPDGLDPDEYILREQKDKFFDLVKGGSTTAVEFLTEQALGAWGIDTPEAKAKTAGEVIPFIAKIKNNVLRREWVRYLAGRLQTTESAIADEVQRRHKPARGKQQAAPKPAPEPGHSAQRSAEEEILRLLCAYPQYRDKISGDFFRQDRTKRVYAQLLDGVPIADIAGHLDEAEVAWFTELVLDERDYDNPGQTLASMLRESRQKELELQRQQLEKTVIQMLDGKIPKDNQIIQTYLDLNKQLKGSVKS